MQLSKLEIDRNKTVANCKVCGGSGNIIVNDGKKRPTKNPDRVISFPRAVMCECRCNEIVENSYPMLGNPKLPKIPMSMASQYAKLLPINKNLWFEGSFDKFILAVKAVFVDHRRSGSFIGYVANGLEMVLEYYVAQPKDSVRTFRDLTHNQDIVVVVANTKVKNVAVGPALVELIQARNMIGKSTWVYTPKDFDMCAEYTSDLKTLLSEFVPKKF